MPTSKKADQSDKFEQAARELECDDDPEHFAEIVRRVAKAPPAPQSKPTKPPKGEAPE